MNTVIETSLDGVIVSDDSGTILEYSQAAETIFGFNAAEAVGKNLADLIIPDHHRTAHDNAMQRIRSGGDQFIVGTGRVRMDALRKDRSLFPVEFSIQAAQTSKGQIFIAFLRDVSSTIAAEQDLVTARDAALAGEKLKTDFLATMSHEIRTPLNGLLGNLSLLADTERCERQDRIIGDMETSGRLLMNHISDVLDITRYDAGVMALDIVPMNVSILLQDIIDSQSATAAASSTTLNWAWHGPKRDCVLSDPDRVQLILMNLIGNAVKFTQDGHVSVKAEIIAPKDAASPLRFCVTDTGPGIDPALIPRIFDDFVTGNAAYDRDVGGTGLGLSIAKRFATALGGTISVESDLGKGSTFEVILPMPPTPQDFAAPKLSSEAREEIPLSILIVEDNEINRVVAREMLEASGHTVAEAHNGRDGVAQANKTLFDVILMDISMPVMDGRAAARLIKSGNGPSATTPIIALTAHASHEDQISFAEAGMVTTLTKPISRTDLREALSDINISNATQGISADNTPDHDMTNSPIYAKLISRFVAELDALQAELQNGDLTLADIGHRAHHAAGSAATFQSDDLAEPLQQLAIAARAADDAQLDAASAAFETAWQTKRTSFIDDAPTQS
jgi:PAS domain S-box-containing protein